MNQHLGYSCYVVLLNLASLWFQKPLKAADSLLLITQTGTVAFVQSTIKGGANINQTDVRGRTPLMLAVIAERPEIAKILLESGANTELRDNKGQTANDLAGQLHNTELLRQLREAGLKRNPSLAFLEAARNSDLNGIKQALANGADVNSKFGDTGTTALMFAVMGGDSNMRLLQLLLEKGAFVNAVDRSGEAAIEIASRRAEALEQALIQKGAAANGQAKQLNSALWRAVEDNDIDMVAALLSKGADPNNQFSPGRYRNQTVLMVAADKGHGEIVGLLLKKGARSQFSTTFGDYENNLGETALHLAARGGHFESAKELLSKGAPVNAVTKAGTTPLMLAVQAKNGLGVVKLLLASGADVKAKRTGGFTPLMMAADSEAPAAVISILIDAGADLSAQTDNGDVLSIAVQVDRVDLVKLLLEREMSQNSKNTALMWAASKRKYESATLLVRGGADPNAQDKNGRSSLQFAAQVGDERIVKLLVEAGAKERVQGYTPAGDPELLPKSETVTRAAWKALIAPFDVSSARFAGKRLSAEGFTKKFGEPTRTQKIGEFAYWYYACLDGALQIVIIADSLEQQGLVIKTINEL